MSSSAVASLMFDHIDLRLKSEAGDVHVLKDISLALPSGQAISVVGPSGSGKTSLLMIASGLERPTSGRVAVAGTVLNDLSEDAVAAFRRQHIGIVFQNFHLIPTMTAVENVAVPLELAGRADAFAVAKKTLNAVGLGHRLTHYPGQLSGGEQQRVAIARAFAPRPSLILADEPTGNLDRDTGRQVADLMFAMAKENGTTFVLVTHDPQLAARCDATLHIADGRTRLGERPLAA